jgi:hypothetical protein
MYKTICGAFVLIVVVSSALSLQCQSSNDKVPVPRTEPARSMSIPYAVWIRSTTIQTKADGSAATQQSNDVTAQDSQGRRLMATTLEADGFGGFSVDDPVAGTRAVWNTENRQARVLTFPTAIPGRESCWRIPEEDQRFVRGEQLLFFSAHCQPAERHQPPFNCSVHGSAVEPPRDDSPEAKPTYEDCSRVLASQTISGKMSEKDEDLGVNTIFGVEVHGCRSTIAVPSGTNTRELWWAKFGTARRNVSFSLRRVDEYPDQTRRTVRTTSEATNLRLGEPDASTFHPPDNYEITRSRR